MAKVTRISEWLNKGSENDACQTNTKPLVTHEAKNKAIRELTKAVRFHFHKGKKLEMSNKALQADLDTRDNSISEFAETLHLYEIILDQQEDRQKPRNSIFAV